MSQRLVQQGKSRQKLSTKRLTIHEISPMWSRIIPLVPKTEQQEFYQKGKVLDISDARLCIVGEAHGFNRDYFESYTKDFCKECFAHSVEFGALLLDPPSKREAPIQAFVNHWNNNHT